MNAPATERTPFRPFTRVVTTPPAWPWDQARAAKLEAQHTSPVSGGDATVLVRRLKPWVFNESGEFVAIYLRSGDTAPSEGFDIEVQGKRLRIELPSRAKREAALRDRAWQIGAAAVIVLALVGLTLLALQRRADLEDRLSQAELRMQRQDHRAKAIALAKADARALTNLGVKDQGVDQVVHDLTRVAVSKSTNAQLDAFYWRKGYWAVEARGDFPPVQGMDIELQRSVKPVRRGVWLWAGKSAEHRP